jgi:hypothetical protein
LTRLRPILNLNRFRPKRDRRDLKGNRMENLHIRRRHWLVAIAAVAGLGMGVLPAAAKPAYTDRAVRAQVRVGLTPDEVTQLLGRPTKTRKYREGSTWGYQLGQENWFLVDFGTDGKVKQAEEKFIAAW